MFKKIVNFFFTEEEEYIHEEELDRNDTSDHLEIPPLKPFVNKPVEHTKTVEKPMVKPTFVETREELVVTQTQEKKSVMINLDEPIQAVREVSLKKEPVKPAAPYKYQPTEIISPIFGGPKPSEKVNPVSAVKKEAVKKTMTSSVISPMFGAVVSEAETQKQSVDMDLDITDLLSPERGNEEIQVSLYDYLEEMERDE